jgi:hypothetical protein
MTKKESSTPPLPIDLGGTVHAEDDAPRVEEDDAADRRGGMDPELLTLKRMMALMETLPDPAARERVTNYLTARFKRTTTWDGRPAPAITPSSASG